jgi:hypothetical protein
MPAATPNITLTATLLDLSGNELGSATAPCWLRIALCGFGAALPVIPGTANIGKVSSWFVDYPYIGAPFTGATAIKLWGNDQIAPLNQTYYAISILDAQRNVLQTGMYQFTGTATIDLSNATQITPPAPVFAAGLVCEPLSGSYPGTVFTAPTTVWGTGFIGLFYRGALQRLGIDWTQTTPQEATLNFTATKDGSGNATVYAIYVQGVG